MPYLNDADLDALLNNARPDMETLHICSQEPTNYTEASSTYSLGNKAAPSVAAPSDRGGGGREVVVSAISDENVTATGTATHWAMVRNTATARLVATGALASSQAVTNGNTFTLSSFSVGVTDAQ